MTTVSTAAFYERSNLQLSSLRRRAEELQGQIGTGERLARSSDDPIAAARLRGLDRAERLNEVDQINSDRASANLRVADNTLESMANVVIRVRELALQASNGTLSDQNRAAIGTEISQLQESLLAFANARDVDGHALFGGETAGNAYQSVAGVVSYIGTAQAPVTDLGAGQSVPNSITGPEVLSFDAGAGTTDMFVVLSDLATALAGGGTAAQTAASDALATLDAGLEKITTAQTLIGTRQAWVETIDNRRTDTGELLAEERSEVGGADLASTITRLQELLTVLEASQSSFVRLSSLSLFNQLS